MSSEAITRNDLRAILNEVLPVEPSEYKKLLWTNAQGAQTSYSFTADFSKYDELEVVFDRQGGLYTFYCETSGSATFIFPYNDYLVRRTATILGNTFTFGNGSAYTSYNTGSSGLYDASYAVPSKVYGIKYEYVQPPAIIGATDYIVDSGTETVNGVAWTYRKWDSGKYEAWAFSSSLQTHYVTFSGWYGYYADIALPSFMLTKDNLFLTCPLSNGTQYCMPSGYVISANSVRAYCVSAGSGTQNIYFNLFMVGEWK